MKKRNLVIFLIAVATLSVLAYFFSEWISQWVNLKTLKGHRDFLIHARENKFVALVFFLLFTLIVTLSLPITGIFILAAGFMFGTMSGLIGSLFVSVIGATISFWIFHFLKQKIYTRYEKQLTVFNAHIKKEGASYILILHLVSVVPYFLINMLAAASEVSLWTFIWTTAVGIIPSTFVYAYAGSQLAKIESVADIFSPNLILALVMIVTLIIGSLMWKRFKVKDI